MIALGQITYRFDKGSAIVGYDFNKSALTINEALEKPFSNSASVLVA